MAKIQIICQSSNAKSHVSMFRVSFQAFLCVVFYFLCCNRSAMSACPIPVSADRDSKCAYRPLWRG